MISGKKHPSEALYQGAIHRQVVDDKLEFGARLCLQYDPFDQRESIQQPGNPGCREHHPVHETLLHGEHKESEQPQQITDLWSPRFYGAQTDGSSAGKKPIYCRRIDHGHG